MELNFETISKMLSNIQVNMLVAKHTARDTKYEYILDGVEFNMVTIKLEDEDKHFEVYDKYLARYFMYDFITNSAKEDAIEALYLYQQRENFIDIFDKADERGYNEFKSKVEERIRPYQNTDTRVTQTIFRILNESRHVPDDEVTNLNSKFIYTKGYKNGLIRRAAEFICDFPEMFTEYPNLLLKYKSIDTSQNYYFADAFWSRASFDQALAALSPEFLSADGHTWNYRQKGNKTAFIALFEELFVKNYLKKRLSPAEIRSIAQNSFSLDISERTFNEAETITKAQSLFKYLTRHHRHLSDDDDDNI